MRVNPQIEPWSRRLTSEVGQRLRAERARQGLSAQEVAERTRLLGHEVKRSLIADMENGRRPVFPVADLFALSAALNVPPLMLLLPPLVNSEVEVLPGQSVSASEALDWFEGLQPLGTGRLPWSSPLDDDGDASDWHDHARPLIKRSEYRALVAEARVAHRKLRQLMKEASKAKGVARGFYIDRLETPATELHDLLVDLAMTRELAEESGIALPELDLPGDAVWQELRELSEPGHAADPESHREVG